MTGTGVEAAGSAGAGAQVLGGGLALASAALWAVSALLWTRLGRTLSPVGMNAARGVLTVAFCAVILAFTGLPDLSSAGWGILALSGVLGIAVGDSAYFHALQHLGPRRMLVVTTLVPVAASGLAILFLGERPGWRWVAGTALCMAGVWWVLRERLPGDAGGGDGRRLAGVLLALATVAFEAAGVFLSKVALRDSGTQGPLDATFVRLLSATVALLALGAARGQIRAWFRPLAAPRLAGELALASFLGTFLGIGLSMAALWYADVSLAAVLNSLSPVFMLPLSAFVLRERVTPRAVAGALVAVAGVAVLLSGG